MACGLFNLHCSVQTQFPDQGLNPGPLHWKQSLSQLDHQGNMHFKSGSKQFRKQIYMWMIPLALDYTETSLKVQPPRDGYLAIGGKTEMRRPC